MILYLDTHAVVWLYAGDRALFSARAVAAVDHARLLYSPMVELEVRYLFETGRIAVDAPVILDYLAERAALAADTTPFPAVISAAREVGWTRDPFDRIITATAMINGQPLLTKDRHIRQHYSNAFWDDSD